MKHSYSVGEVVKTLNGAQVVIVDTNYEQGTCKLRFEDGRTKWDHFSNLRRLSKGEEN